MSKYLFILLIVSFKSTIGENNLTYCTLPSICRFQKVNILIDASAIDKMLGKFKQGLRCEFSDENFSFNFNISQIRHNGYIADCLFKGDPLDGIAELRWPPQTSTPSILDASLNLTNLFDFISTFYASGFSLNLINLKRFAFQIFFDIDHMSWAMNINRVLCLNCKFKFEFATRLLNKTCDQFNETDKIQSIFQMFRIGYDDYYYLYRDYINFTIINGDFKDQLCPFVFNNSQIGTFQLIGLVDSFYKKNLLSFSNHTFPYLNSWIKQLELDKVQNIDLDLKFLNRDVFKNLETIYIFGSINKIDEGIFKTFKWLYLISFKTTYFRKIMHLNGIDWIRAINSNVTVNVSNSTAIWNNFKRLKFLNLDCFYYSQEEKMSTVFPDKDFCLYVEFPFKQLVLLIQLCGYQVFTMINTDFSCTYLWLIQYYSPYHDAYYIKYLQDLYEYRIDYPVSGDYLETLRRVYKESMYYSTVLRCNFTQMRLLCDKNQYSVRDIWGLYDYFILNKKLEIAFKVSSYVFSFLGIITNLIVIVTISHKKNIDLYNGCKQYDYLCYNSIFSLLMLVIQLFSWMSECFYPYEVFCPEIRKLVFIQVFKMVFKECFVTAFRFMWIFSYIAFALNRISLIGKDHGKLVQFMSDIGVKSYLAVCFLISCGLSVIKYFKYEINYDQPETSYPISNDHDLSSIHRTFISNDGVIIANSIFDILNYVVFELLIFVIDVYLVVRMRRILNERLRKSESLMAKNKLETMKKENEEAINKVIKMVIVNTAISVLFKLPVAFIPVVNVYAEFYYKDYLNQFDHPKFGAFYSFLLDSGFYDFFLGCSDLLFNLSLFLQLFIYRHFDKLFKIGLCRLISKNDYSKSNNSNRQF